jgi:hypothetical protein
LNKKHEEKVAKKNERKIQIKEEDLQRQARMMSALLSESNGSSNQGSQHMQGSSRHMQGSSRYMQGSSRLKDASRRLKRGSILFNSQLTNERSSISMVNNQMNKQRSSLTKTSFSQAHFLAPRKGLLNK